MRSSEIAKPLLLTLLLFHPASGMQLRPIVHLGDRVAGTPIAAGGSFEVGPLNDAGLLCFSADVENGGRLLIQSAGDSLTPIVAPGQPGPLGTWPDTLWFDAPMSMNAQGDVLFSGLLVSVGSDTTGGTFLWERATQRLSPIALPGMSFVPGQILEWAAGPAPAINRTDEMALVVNVRNAAGRDYPGVFRRSEEGRLMPVALPDQELPGGGKIAYAVQPSLTDAGVIGLLAQPQGADRASPCLWEQGTLRPLPVPDVEPPPGLVFFGFDRIWLNNRNESVLLSGHLHGAGEQHVCLYRFEDERLEPIVLPGQEMPGGGRFATVQALGVSAANELGQHAFLATLADGATACYLLEPDGRLSLLLKSGAETDLGTIASVGVGSAGSGGIGLNSRSEVAVTIAVAGSPDAIVRLTPSPSINGGTDRWARRSRQALLRYGDRGRGGRSAITGWASVAPHAIVSVLPSSRRMSHSRVLGRNTATWTWPRPR
jgi:hypothetical protein